ncbi:DUF1697 domain-containing protein [Enterococcus sp. BWT-B8]|uniref:DUF1697 domain-containing protein n=1 Tax=unclassified Enterococcus TaxID=2608891 RepID=UPI001E3FCD86|nr:MULTISPECIES: DUF1697 domain-containing protein [unclassified Enterococcus]MCB5950466.1 DUF1697 domain-containing protein [Enterococcus sp. BWT-B8]MCB5954349.1 DUF1697 domain-containing protein [Enterococcus sp. CWB-B31]
MKKYIALLRGINVGGKNKISMPVLRTVFEELGFSDVVTYINSGNVVFSSVIQDEVELIKKCEEVILERFKLTIPVAVISADDLAEAMENAPEWWNTDKESVHYTIFVLSPIRVEEIYAGAGEVNPEFEQVGHHGNVIFWSAPLKTYSKAKWSKIARSSVNSHVTIRNANTVNKLLLMTQ